MPIDLWVQERRLLPIASYRHLFQISSASWQTDADFTSHYRKHFLPFTGKQDEFVIQCDNHFMQQV
ncbi:hypothetical protein N9E57_02070 [Gammaproteobacteria bacterium]|nr:hypothetical protein [Gammaproteobacteria bacterium]MBT6041935.1 hypothetical protein [Gammaproteobacteria bacterium]MDA9909291.1 hypothetical protein [Gammaproteobacteria bacterium]